MTVDRLQIGIEDTCMASCRLQNNYSVSNLACDQEYGRVSFP